MKIGILTLPLHANYGGNLQAYALMKVIKDLGHEVFLIDRKRNRIPRFKAPLRILKKTLIKELFKRGDIDQYSEVKENFINEIVATYALSFIEKYIEPKTETFYTTKEMQKGIGKYQFDAIIVGSDQVWKPAYAANIYDYFLDFAKGLNVRKVAYAASFGGAEWTYSLEQTSFCSELLKEFDAVGVRESSAIELCNAKLNFNKALHVLDPTMLLEASDYIKLIEKHPIKKVENGLLVYILDETVETKRVVKELSSAKNLKPFKVNSRINDKTLSVLDRVAPPIEDWLAGFYNADFIFADSFHACVFSIIFNKPFIAYGNKKRGLARFESLLNMFGLSERLITDPKMISIDLINGEIDWSRVNEKLEAEKLNSIRFLEEALN